MWCYQCMLSISWMHQVTNHTVLPRIGKERDYEFNQTMKAGHIMRNNKCSTLHLVMQEKINGK